MGGNKLFSQGLIETSTSPWASPIVIARHKNGRLLLAIDYRRLNSLTINSHYPLPAILFPEPAILLSRNERLWDNPSHSRF